MNQVTVTDLVMRLTVGVITTIETTVLIIMINDEPVVMDQKTISTANPLISKSIIGAIILRIFDHFLIISEKTEDSMGTIMILSTSHNIGCLKTEKMKVVRDRFHPEMGKRIGKCSLLLVDVSINFNVNR